MAEDEFKVLLDDAGVPGGWAVVRRTAPYGLVADLDGADLTKYQTVDLILQALVVEWSLTQRDGTPLPIPAEATPRQLRAVDYRVVGRLMEAAQEALGTLVPKAGPSSEF